MKFMMWFLIVGVPCAIALSALGIIMRIQHWPFGYYVSTASTLLVLALLIVAWVFALRFLRKKEPIRFDSI